MVRLYFFLAWYLQHSALFGVLLEERGGELPLSVVNWQVVGEVWWGVRDQKEHVDQGKERGEW